LSFSICTPTIIVAKVLTKPVECSRRIGPDGDGPGRVTTGLGVIAEASTAEQLGQYLDAERARWAKLAKDIGVVPE